MANVIQNVCTGLANTILPPKNAHTLPINQGKIIICLYKSIPEDVVSLLKTYGKVIIWSSIYENINCDLIEFDYFIIDLREEQQRLYYQSFILHKTYRLVLYRHSFETNNGIAFHNEITDFPPKRAFRNDFDTLLFQEPLPVPRWYVSLFRVCCCSVEYQHQSYTFDM